MESRLQGRRNAKAEFMVALASSLISMPVGKGWLNRDTTENATPLRELMFEYEASLREIDDEDDTAQRHSPGLAGGDREICQEVRASLDESDTLRSEVAEY